MKKTFKLLACATTLFCAQNTFATIITVDNNNGNPAQYTIIQDAINAATNGDSIYVSGSATGYAGFTCGKELHFFGAGFNPDKQNPQPTTINTQMTFEVTGTGSTVLTDASGSSMAGFNTTANVQINGYSSTHLISNLEFTRNKLSGVSIASFTDNLRFINNQLNNIVGGNFSQNILIQNNIIGLYNLQSSSTNSGTVLCSNNLLRFATSLSNIQNTIFSNNIFYGYSPNGTNNNNCTFTNNLSFQSSDNNFPIGGTNSGGNNLVGVDPLFISATSPSGNLLSSDDFNFQTGSPATNAGSDNTDIGIYGGAYPWPEGGASGSGFMYAQEADIPQVNEFNILNSTVPLNGTLNVQVKGISNH